MINKYSSFISEEVNYKTLNSFKDKELSSKFTCSIEIELETKDKNIPDEEYDEEYVLELTNRIKNSVIKELNRLENFSMSKKSNQFLEDLISEIQQSYDDYDYLLDELLDDDSYSEKDFKKLIVQIVRPQVMTYFFEENFEYLEDNFKKYMRNFHRKWRKDIKFELDNTLDRGIEISNKSYFNDINTLIEFINDFYVEYNSQKYWTFNSKTGIHINIGIKENEDYNYIKGLVFLDDSGESPFVFQNMEWRQKSKFCGSIKSTISKNKKIMDLCRNKIKVGDINGAEEIINPVIESTLRDLGYKKFGVNLLPLKNHNYIEFRYPGGKITEKTLIDKVLYFTYIVHNMTNPSFEVRDYHKKLYKFLFTE